jgi:signal transduction histidine kinase
LSLGLISVMVIVGLVLAQTSLWLFEMGLQRYLEAGLRNDSENLLVALVRGPQGLQLDERHLSPAYQRPFSGHYFRIDFADNHWRSRSLWDQELPRLEHPGLDSDLQLGPEGQQLLVLRSDYRRLGQSISISVAQDYTPVRESFRRMRRSAWARAGGIAADSAAATNHRAARLAPAGKAREQIAQLQQGQRSQLDDQVPVELEPLVAQINHLLAHTEDSLKRSRNALGNLGHALKTPLAVLLSLASSAQLDAIRAAQDPQGATGAGAATAQSRTQPCAPGRRCAAGCIVRLRCRTAGIAGDLEHDPRRAPDLSARAPRACNCRGIVRTCWNCSATCWTTPANGRMPRCA